MVQKKKSDASAANKPVRGLDFGEIERVLQFMEKHRLEQFEYERDGVHILLKKAAAQTPAQGRSERTYESHGRAAAEEPVAAPAPLEHAGLGSGTEKSAEEGLHVVKSPIVGTFYAAGSPDARPFVSVGTLVEAGQVLCIIEAMKLMNEIEADVSGEVVKIFVENGHPVEYGERLFGIRTGK